MKTLFLIFALSLHVQTVRAQASRPLILSAGVSPLTYQQFLAQHPGFTSVADFLASLPSQSDEKVYALADHLEDPADQLLSEIENLHKEISLNENSQLFLRDLLDKAGAKPLTASQRKIWQGLSCLIDNLLGLEDSSQCKTDKIPISEIQRIFPWAEGLKIENRFIRLQGHGKIVLVPAASYHFQILSNTHKTVFFYGTLAQLKQQSFQPEAWVSGSCDEFSTTVDDFSLQEQGSVFFSDACVQSVKNPVQKSTLKRWAQENKNWLYAGGAFVLGAVVYGMKNKKLVIDTSGFN